MLKYYAFTGDHSCFSYSCTSQSLSPDVGGPLSLPVLEVSVYPAQPPCLYAIISSNSRAAKSLINRNPLIVVVHRVSRPKTCWQRITASTTYLNHSKHVPWKNSNFNNVTRRNSLARLRVPVVWRTLTYLVKAVTQSHCSQRQITRPRMVVKQQAVA